MKRPMLGPHISLGDSTAYYGGQVTLNPLPHIQHDRLEPLLYRCYR